MLETTHDVFSLLKCSLGWILRWFSPANAHFHASNPITSKNKSFQTKHQCEAFQYCVPAPVYFSQLSFRYISRSITVGASHCRAICFDKKAPSIEARGVKHSNWQVYRTKETESAAITWKSTCVGQNSGKSQGNHVSTKWLVVKPFVEHQHNIT